MATLSQIDRSKVLMMCGSKATKTTDPEMIALAEKMELPQLLVFQNPVGETLTIPANETELFLERVSQPDWRSAFEGDLQGMCETNDGEPLLTTWLAIDSFRRFAEGLTGLPFQSSLLAAVQGWEALGADTVFLDGYELVCKPN